MQDDLILNISKPSAPSKHQQSSNSPSENKREKYSMKFKKENAKNNRGRRQFQYNLLPTSTEKREENHEAMKTEEKGEEKESFKRPNRFSNSRNQSSQNRFQGRKMMKREQNSRQYLPVEVLDAYKVSVTTPIQIQPEAIILQNKIDVNPLQKYKLNPLLLDSLLKNQITKFTQIQMQCFDAIYTKKDCIAKASTGSGKTLAYLIPLINQYLDNKIATARDCGTVMLIICPSRQLCVQGQKQVLRCLKRCPFIVPGVLIGGQQTNHEKNRLRKGINILFCTPGRLLYHLQNTQAFKYSNLKTLIFEEGDRTLDMGFQQNVKDILEILSKKADFETIQKILVSAHFNEKVQNLIQNLNMISPTYIGFQKKSQQQQDDNRFQKQQINISKNLKQQYVLMTEEQRIPLIIAYLRLTKDSKVMIFVNTIDEVEYLDFLLNNMKYRDSNGNFTQEKVEERKIFKIHGDLDQKYRSNTYFQFRKQKKAILVSTEVASRGLDFPDLNHIILFDVPATITDYGNRVGRTARYNSSGVSLLMLHYQQSDYAEKIRYYSPTLEQLDKDIIYNGFQKYLDKLNIHERGLYYLEGVVRSLVKDDSQKYQLARKAYVSMLRAYAKHKDKHTFAIKKLDLKLLGRCFGINSTGGKQKTYNAKAKQSHLEAQRKRRKVENVRQLQVSEYL